MTNEMPPLEVNLIYKKAVRIERAHAELTKPAIPPLFRLAWVATLGLMSWLAQSLGLSGLYTGVFLLGSSGLIYALGQLFVLQRKVRALTELLQLQSSAPNAPARHTP